MIQFLQLNRTAALGKVAALALALATSAPVLAQGEDVHQLGESPVRFGSLLPVVNETGLISVSIDGLGMRATSGNIQVDKPAGATVRSAYLASASTGYTDYVFFGPLTDYYKNVGVRLLGVPITWDIITPSSIYSWNHWADVTSIVKPVVDAAGPGIVNLQVQETNEFYVEGEILAVIFDDPGAAAESTVVLAFGAQAISGDTFAIGLAEPIDLSDPNLVLDFSLGISYGYQPTNQVSLVDVNGQRLTSSAGGQDDGVPYNGALITVGGIGDDFSVNPPPYGSASNPRYDDEAYNLIPFVEDGDTSIVVDTINPSNDDNIFFAALQLSGSAIVGEGILLSPTFAENPTGTTHTLTASVQDDDGNPVVGRQVDFEVVSGPHAGTTGSDTTDASGEATFSYLGSTAGNDVIVASFVDSLGETQTSNEAIKRWIQVNTPPTCRLGFTEARDSFLEPTAGSFIVTEGQTLVVAVTADDVDGDDLTLSLTGPTGATLADTGGAAPFTTTIGWTPTAADKGPLHAFTVTVTDPTGASEECTFYVEDVNLNPDCAIVAENGEVVAECEGMEGTVVQLQGSATDADDVPDDEYPLEYLWAVSDATVVLDDPTLPNPTGSFPEGVTMATLTVTDGRGGISFCDVNVVVEDTTPPEIQCTSDIAMLWPPNHKMQTVTFLLMPTDACTDPSAIVPTSVTISSDESDNDDGVGDGNTDGDVNGFDGHTTPVDITPTVSFDEVAQVFVVTVDLRAERQGTGNGRKYTIDISAIDSSGNEGVASCCVIVPHDQRGKKK